MRVVFAGYGIVAADSGSQLTYDSYKEADVQGKWVLIFRYLPEKIDPKLRAHLTTYSRIPFKVATARARGAKGVLLVSGPNSNVRNQLISLNSSGLSGQSAIPVISISDDLANDLLKSTGKNLSALQSQIDRGGEVGAFELKELALSAEVDIVSEKGSAQNVLGLLRVPGAKSTIVIGAHGDHLGEGKDDSSLMSKDDKSTIHYGADDNASGMSGIMELAHYFNRAEIKKTLKHNLLFAIWSGEEKGTLGSQHFIEKQLGGKKTKSLYPQISAYINMDMIGRYRDAVAIQGVGSSSGWSSVIEKIGRQIDISLSLQKDPYLPTDAMPFYLAGVPVASFFTGAHGEYHTPRDRAETINFGGTESVVKAVAALAQALASNPKVLPYDKVARDPKAAGARGGFRLYLGTIPDYSKSQVKGVLLGGVVPNGPADKAGLQKGDVITQFGGQKIETIYDYVYALQTIKPFEKTTITVLREGKPKELEITPSSKE